MTKRYGHWISGADTRPVGGTWLRSTRPGGDELVCEIAEGDERDVARATQAAIGAFGGWWNRKPVERGRVLARIAEELRAQAGELGQLEAAEAGKPEWQARLEVEGAAGYFEFYAGLVNLPRGEVIDLGPGFHAYTRQEPYGVIGVITPWNAPLNQAARAIAPALAAGNVVVVKPSEFTSATTLELARIADRCGLPPGVLSVVTGTGAGAGQALVSDVRVRKVAFTGSVRAAKEIGRIAADRILPLTLELGGKSPHIIFHDADLTEAAAVAVRAFVGNAGQICSNGTRLLVADEIHDEFLDVLTTAVATVKPGQTYGSQTTLAQYEKVLAYFDIAREEGATLLTGGGTLREPGAAAGWLVEPTVYTDVTNDMRIAREEIFGPVLTVLRFSVEDEAIRIANDSPYGLAAGLWTRDLARAHRVAARLEAGQVFVNDWLTALVEGSFGGFKGSGYGREKGIEALLHYTQSKFIAVKV